MMRRRYVTWSGRAVAAAVLVLLAAATLGASAAAGVQLRAAGEQPVVVLVGGLGSDVPTVAEDPSGGAWNTHSPPFTTSCRVIPE